MYKVTDPSPRCWCCVAHWTDVPAVSSLAGSWSELLESLASPDGTELKVRQKTTSGLKYLLRLFLAVPTNVCGYMESRHTWKEMVRTKLSQIFCLVPLRNYNIIIILILLILKLVYNRYFASSPACVSPSLICLSPCHSLMCVLLGVTCFPSHLPDHFYHLPPVLLIIQSTLLYKSPVQTSRPHFQSPLW